MYLPKSSASEACSGLSSSVRSAPCPNFSGSEAIFRVSSEEATCSVCPLPTYDRTGLRLLFFVRCLSLVVRVERITLCKS